MTSKFLVEYIDGKTEEVSGIIDADTRKINIMVNGVYTGFIPFEAIKKVLKIK